MFTYKWADLIELVKKQVKGIPTQPIDALQCDWVSSRIANRLGWKPLQQTIAAGQIPLIDNQQDYDPPFNISKLTEASLRLTSVMPGEDISLNILDSLPRDPRRRSVYAITSIALQAGVGKLRLVAAVAIPVNQTWELRGQYEMNPTKIISTEQGLWFDDKYVHLAIEGLKYCYFQMADDPRAGTTSGTWPGDISYSGQLAQFMSGIKEMADAETRNVDQQTFPDAPLGIASRQYGAMIAGYGFGFGGGTGVQQQGLVAINNDTTPMQYLVAGPGISITSVGIGYTMISVVGALPPPAEPPTVTGISPTSGPTTGGTSVTITGTNFAPGMTVLFAGSAATNVVVTSATTLTAVTPPGTTGAVTVWVSVQGQSASLPNAFTYIYVAPPPTPTVTSVSPNVGPANATTAVTITGTNFASGATVTFGGTAATNVVVVNATTITCTAPSRAAGAVTVAVTVSGQTGSLANGFTYQAAAQPIWGGLGAANDSTGVTPFGTNQLALVPYSGDILSVLQNTAEQVGQSWAFSPATQCVCLVLYGGSHTFVDQSANNIPFVAPVPVTVNGNAMFLYSTQFQLFLPITVKVNT